MEHIEHNIGPRQRRLRAFMGVGMLLVSLAAAALLFHFQVDRLWRLALAAPLFAAGLGLFQAQAGT